MPVTEQSETKSSWSIQEIYWGKYSVNMNCLGIEKAGLIFLKND
jgi:hypothetical protein